MRKNIFLKILLAALLSYPVISASPVSATRSIDFSGYSWTVKNGQMGPHANYWNDDPRAVFVDGEGRLHLKITNRGNRWYSSEVYLPTSLGHGTYTFELANRVDLTDTNLVAATFLYADDSREYDIEFTNWRHEVATNAQYVIQPYPPASNIDRFPINLTDGISTHHINWSPDNVIFSSWQGANRLREWNYTGPNRFNPGDERVHINFWMIQRTPPSDGQEKEIIIKRFIFTPFTSSTISNLNNTNTTNSTSISSVNPQSNSPQTNIKPAARSSTLPNPAATNFSKQPTSGNIRQDKLQILKPANLNRLNQKFR